MVNLVKVFLRHEKRTLGLIQGYRIRKALLFVSLIAGFLAPQRSAAQFCYHEEFIWSNVLEYSLYGTAVAVPFLLNENSENTVSDAIVGVTTIGFILGGGGGDAGSWGKQDCGNMRMYGMWKYYVYTGLKFKDFTFGARREGFQFFDTKIEERCCYYKF